MFRNLRSIDLFLPIAITIAAALYGWLSVAAYSAYNTGMLDLGNMSQAMWSTLHGRPLEFTSRSGTLSRLGLHVEVIYFLLAPIYALWPDPRTLLIVQALLMALGALPVYSIAMRRLGSRFAARAFTVAYLLYPTAVAAVLFDFHGDTLAMPLLLFALDALDRQAWTQYGIFIGLSLLSKFYIAAPVALLGLALLSPSRSPLPVDAELAVLRIGRWQVSRVGLLTGAAALLYGLLAFFVIRPLFSSVPTTALYGTGNYTSYYFAGPFDNIAGRIVAVAAVLVPSALLGFWAPLALLPALAIVLPAALSTGPAASYDFRYHHYAAAVPFIIVSAILGARRRANQARRRRPAEASALLVSLLVLIFHIAFNHTPLGITFWRDAPGYGLDPSGYGRTERDQLKDRWLAEHVPAEVPIAASNFLASHLTNRYELYLLRYPTEREPEVFRRNFDRVEMVVADALMDYYVNLDNGYAGGIMGEAEALALTLSSPEFALVEEQDGLLLFQRNANAAAALPQWALQTATPPPPANSAALRFGDAIELVGYSVEPLGGRRYRLELHWRALRPFTRRERYAAVSRLHGPDGAVLRYPQLGTMALLPTDQWQPGQTIVETRTIALPEEAPAGSYRWTIGWYNPAHPLAAWSDPAALLRGSSEQPVGLIEVSAP